MADEKIKEILKKKIVGTNVAHKPSVYVTMRKSKNPKVNTWSGEITADSNFDIGEGVRVAFIDHMPGANFEHRVEYAFINEKSEVVQTMEATTPPNDLESNFKIIDIEN